MTQWIITSSVLILIIAVLRFVLRGKISLKLQYALWGLVLIRLILPFSVFESPASVLNLMNERKESYTPPAYSEPYVPETVTPAVPDDDIFILDDNLEHIKPDNNIVIDDNGFVTELEIKVINWGDVLKSIWLVGIVVFGAVFAVSNLRFRKKLKTTREYVNGTKAWLPVYESSAVKTPCLFGAIKPAIYITKVVLADEKVLSHVLEHETTHYRHGDHVWSVLRCFCLALHWYNPFVWLAAFLSMRDSELACDEDTIRRIGEEERIGYGRTLINLTCEKPAVGIFSAATTMTGSKSSIKERIVLIAKKPKMLKITAVLVAMIAVFAVGCTFTGAVVNNPKIAKVEVIESFSHRLEPELTGLNGVIRMSVTSASPEEITTKIYNKSSEEICYSTGYALHFEKDGKWYELDKIKETTDTIFSEVQTKFVSPESESSWTNVSKESFGKLPDGKYRIIRTVSFGEMDISENEFYVIAAEFILADGNFVDAGPIINETKFAVSELIYRHSASSFLGFSPIRYEIPEWKWEEFPYTDEEWKNLFFAPDGFPFPDISQYEERYYQRLDSQSFIAYLDGELWSVYLSPKKASTPDDLWVWDVYRVVPEEEEAPKTDDMVGKDHSSELSVSETIDGTRISARGNILGLSPSMVIDEIPNEIYYINFKDGTPAIGHPVDSYFEYCYDDLISQSPEQWKHYCVIECTYNYNWYRYEKNEEGVYELVRKEEQSRVPFGKFIKTTYYWSCKYMGMGLEDKDGNVLLEPIYSRINNRFGDRILASDGIKQGLDTARDYLFDENLNLLTSEFNDITYYYFEDYSYVGVAHCFGESAEVVCNDENGLVCESGAWFVDKNGKKISEKFQSITMNQNRVESDDGSFARMDPDGTAVVITESGEEKTINVKKDYAMYSEDTYANGFDPFLEYWVSTLYVTKNYKIDAPFPAAVKAVFDAIASDENIKYREFRNVEFYGDEKEFFAAYSYIDAEGAGQTLQVRMRKTEDGYGLLAKGGGPIGYGLAKRNGTPLTADEIRRVSEAFEAFRLENGVADVNLAANFLQGEFNRPEEINAAAFLYYFPSGMLITDEAEFEDLKKTWASYGYTVPEGTTIEDYPVPLHKIPKSMVDEALEKYLGIELEKLRYSDLDSLAEGGIYYMEKYDCFYSTASDTHASRFVCESGEIFPDGTVVLYGESGATLILKKHPDGSYKLYAYQW